MGQTGSRFKYIYHKFKPNVGNISVPRSIWVIWGRFSSFDRKSRVVVGIHEASHTFEERIYLSHVTNLQKWG